MIDFWRDPGPFTVAELAKVGRCSPATVRKAIKAGAIKVRCLGRVWRIPGSEARRWALEVGAEPELPDEMRETSRDARDVRDASSAAGHGRSHLGARVHTGAGEA